MTHASLLYRKLLGLASGRYTARQVLQRVNRSPLRHVVKAAVTLCNPSLKARRRAYARGLAAAAEVGALRELGYVRVAVDAAMLSELTKAAFARWAEVGEEHRRSNKAYLKAFIAGDLEAGRIDNRSTYVRFATQPAVVDLVAAYFGEAPYLSYVALDLSEYAGETLATSQLWHQDHDDTKVVKLFTYLTDVPDAAHGPFTFVPPGPSRAIRATASTHIDDQAVLARVAADAIRRITALAGTSFLVDTGRCFHMGSRVEPGKQRLMFTACYVTRPAIYPDFDNKIAVGAPLTAREALVLRD